MSDTEEQEFAAIEAGFKQALIGAFVQFYNDTDEHTKWSDSAVVRFRQHLANARTARSQAPKVMMEE